MAYDKEAVRVRMNEETMRSRSCYCGGSGSARCRAGCRCACHRLDWGHGPNLPVRTYTETDITRALAAHGPVPVAFEDDDVDLRCSCSHTAGRWPDGGVKYEFVEWNDEHFLNALRELP